MNKIIAARLFQRAAHAGQVRKFSGIPYHTHPEAVLGILRADVSRLTEDMQCAALLHDTIEDTGVCADLIDAEFGAEVARMVVGLTNDTRCFPGTTRPLLKREARHRMTVARLAGQCWAVKTIKLADCLHNLPDIIKHDPKHAKVYVPEKRALLDEALIGGDAGLWHQVDKVIRDYYVANPQKELDTSYVAMR